MAEVSQRSRLSARFVSGSEPFILTAMASLLGGNLWLFRERELLLGHFYRPEILLITHTLTLGWISMLMMGVLVRLAPRAMGISIRSRRWLVVQFLLMLIGYTVMVFYFWISGWVAMASAAVLIVLAAVVQIFNLAGIFTRLRSGDWLHRYVAAALINFLLAAVLGKEPVPAMRDLYSRNLQTVSNGFLSLGVAGAAAGILANYLPLITFFHGLVIIGVLAFLANFFLMARWALLRKPYHPSPEDRERFYVNFHAHRRDAKAPG